MSQKKVGNGRIIRSNLLDQWQELLHQRQGQPCFRARRESIGLHLRLMQYVEDLERHGVRTSLPLDQRILVTGQGFAFSDLWALWFQPSGVCSTRR